MTRVYRWLGGNSTEATILVFFLIVDITTIAWATAQL